MEEKKCSVCGEIYKSGLDYCPFCLSEHIPLENRNDKYQCGHYNEAKKTNICKYEKKCYRKECEFKHQFNLASIVIIFIALVGLLLIVKDFSSDKYKSYKTQGVKSKISEEKDNTIDIRSKISDTAFYPIPTKFGEGYDNTIRKYGVETIIRINKLAPKAAELVAQNPRCTKVITVDVADDRSSRKSLTFYCDCGDIHNISSLERFYVTEKEINANINPKSVKEQMENFDKGKCMLMCEAQIKSRLNYPSTFKTNPLLNSIQVGTMGTIVTINFKAKNAFNLEINHVGRCYYNDKGLADVTIEER